MLFIEGNRKELNKNCENFSTNFPTHDNLYITYCFVINLTVLAYEVEEVYYESNQNITVIRHCQPSNIHSNLVHPWFYQQGIYDLWRQN